MKSPTPVFRLTLLGLLFVVASGTPLAARIVPVSSDDQLREALGNAQPGDTIHIAPGSYRGGHYLADIVGTAKQPVIVEGADKENPPRFSGGGSQALHLVNCAWVVLRGFTVSGYSGNGLNIDDGADYATPAHHITLENLTVRETGPRGNHDAIKLSGLDDFTVRGCRIEGWGGSGVDMVGCHRGVIEDCVFVGRDGFSQSNAIQIKGGSGPIKVLRNYFKDVGHRGVNIGGSTGLQYFRPLNTTYEAKDVEVAGNRFFGSMAPVAWVTAQGGNVHHNTIVYPEKWVARILQETSSDDFEPSHSGVFEKNVIVFDQRVRVFVNVGSRTAPDSFRFRGNVWCEPARAQPRSPSLPTPEEGGMAGPDPQLDMTEGPHGLPRLTIQSRHSVFGDAGSDAYSADE